MMSARPESSPGVLARSLTVGALMSRRTTPSMSARVMVMLFNLRGTAASVRAAARAATIRHTASMVPDDPTATSKPDRSISRTAEASTVRMSRRHASTARLDSLGLEK
jgi:hypothetical protein